MTDDRKFHKTHPYSFVRHLKLSVLLILLSVLQQFLVRPQDIITLISSLSLNALYLLGITGYYLRAYQQTCYRLDPDGIQIRSGVFLHKRYLLPFCRLQTIVFYRSFFSTLFGAQKLSLDTPAGIRRSYDSSAYISGRMAQNVKQRLFHNTSVLCSFKANPVSLILMSAIWSNPITGLVFIVPVIHGAGQIIGTGMTRSLVEGTLNSQHYLTAHMISPAASALAALILICWALSMLLFFMRHAGFRTSRIGGYLVVARGLISHSTTCILQQAVTAVSVDQSLFMKLLQRKTASVSVMGSGRLRGDKGLLLCSEAGDSLEKKLHELTDISFSEEKSVYIARGTLFSYLRFPLILLCLSPVYLFVNLQVAFFRQIGLLLSVFLLSGSLWWLLFRLFAHRHSRIGISGQHLLLCGFRRLMLKTYYIPKNRIARVEFRRSRFQKRSGRCTLRVYLTSERRKVCTIRQLPYAQAQTLLCEAFDTRPAGNPDLG